MPSVFSSLKIQFNKSNIRMKSQDNIKKVYNAGEIDKFPLGKIRIIEFSNGTLLLYVRILFLYIRNFITCVAESVTLLSKWNKL